VISAGQVSRFTYNAACKLLGFAVDAVLAAARAEFVELQPVGVVSLVLGAGVVTLLALGAGQVNYDTVGFLCHFGFLLVFACKCEA
jgi:hypothetical protein